MTTLAALYTHYRNLDLMQKVLSALLLAVVAMILTAFYFCGALYLLRIRKMDLIKVMIGCGVLEVILVGSPILPELFKKLIPIFPIL